MRPEKQKLGKGHLANKPYPQMVGGVRMCQTPEQAGLSWGSVQAETVRLQSWIESGLLDIKFTELHYQVIDNQL